VNELAQLFKQLFSYLDTLSSNLLKGVRNSTYKVEVQNPVEIPDVSFEETNALLAEIREEVKKKSESDIEIEIDRELIKGDKGDKGEQGEPGIPGIQGPAGQDGADGLDGKDGIDGKDGLDGLDGSPDTPEDIRIKLESLKGERRLSAEAIKGLDEYVGKIEIPSGRPIPFLQVQENGIPLSSFINAINFIGATVSIVNGLATVTITGGGAPSGPTNALLAETGDYLITESGDYLVQE
jgi:hypothetical protein